MNTDRLVQRLAGRGVGSVEDLRQALEDPVYQDRSPAEALVAAGIPLEDVYECLAEELDLPLVRIQPGLLSRGVVTMIPREVAEQHAIVPLELEGDTLTLAMADPLDVVAEDVVRFSTHLNIKRVLSPRADIMAGLKAVYQDTRSVESILEGIPLSELELAQDDDDGDEVAGQEDHQSRPIIALVNTLLGDAVKLGASDIHVEPQSEGLRVRFRVDGVLRKSADLPRRVQSAVLSRLKLMAGMDIAERRIPQDGRFRVTYRERDVDLRVNSLPGSAGEKIVLRILDRRSVQMQLSDLGFSPQDRERLEQALDAPQGMLLVTGPTGSGKTTTLYAALRMLNQEVDNLITVEDPVEYVLPGVHQVAIRPKAGLTFSAALRSILRQDPDVVMVGEIRDGETAEIALQAAQTGHLVLSTLHTNDAASTVTRLLHMGMPPYLVGASLLAVVAQRLVRRLCPACRQPAELEPRRLALLESLQDVARPSASWTAPGCEACQFTGFKGRTGLYEVMPISDRLRQLVVQSAPARNLARAAREEGMRLLIEDGLRRVSLGETSLEEVLRVVQVEVEGHRLCPSCERPLDEDFLACPYCTLGVSRFCPHCHKGVHEEWSSCPYCLARLSRSQTPRPNQPAASQTPPEALTRPLPEAPAEPAAAAPAEAEPLAREPARTERGESGAASGGSVLLLTPDPSQGRILRSLVERGGYRPHLLADPEEALEWARSFHPEVILLDLELAREGAFGRLRGQLATAMTPVLLLTRRGPDGVLGLELQADDYLLLPPEPRTLLGKLRHLSQISSR